jgi:hypothetical protein
MFTTQLVSLSPIVLMMAAVSTSETSVNTRIYGVTTQKTFIIAALKTLNLNAGRLYWNQKVPSDWVSAVVEVSGSHGEYAYGGLQDCCAVQAVLMAESANTSETPANMHQVTRCNIPEGSRMPEFPIVFISLLCKPENLSESHRLWTGRQKFEFIFASKYEGPLGPTQLPT